MTTQPAAGLLPLVVATLPRCVFTFKSAHPSDPSLMACSPIRLGMAGPLTLAFAVAKLSPAGELAAARREPGLLAGNMCPLTRAFAVAKLFTETGLTLKLGFPLTRAPALAKLFATAPPPPLVSAVACMPPSELARLAYGLFRSAEALMLCRLLRRLDASSSAAASEDLLDV